MAWLRVDDGMTEHRKVLGLPRKDRWTWLELLAYVARQNNGGHVPDGVCDVLRWVTPTFLKTCSNLGLLDENETGYAVHDWDDYNPKDPTKTERQARWRAKKRESVDGDVDADVDGAVDAPRDVDVDPPARAGARGPSPTPPQELSTATAALHNGAAADQIERLRAAGWTPRQIDSALQVEHGLTLAIAHLDHAEADPTCKKPGALAWTHFENGSPAPPEQRTELAPGAVGTRSKAPELPPRPAEPEIEAAPPPPEFLALAGTAAPPLLKDVE